MPQQPTTNGPAPGPAEAPAPSGRSSVPVPVNQASHLLTSFTHFLTVCIHNILYYRNLYPAQTFLTSRAYNLPVHQSRHPRVCAWVRDAVDALRAQLVRGAAERLALVVYDVRHAAVVERWMFDVARFPAAWSGLGDSARAPGDDDVDDDEDDESDRRVVADGGDGGGGGAAAGNKVNWSNVHEELRAAIRKLAYAGEKMAPLPDGCTFTVAVELREEGEPPIGVCMPLSPPPFPFSRLPDS